MCHLLRTAVSFITHHPLPTPSTHHSTTHPNLLLVLIIIKKIDQNTSLETKSPCQKKEKKILAAIETDLLHLFLHERGGFDQPGSQKKKEEKKTIRFSFYVFHLKTAPRPLTLVRLTYSYSGVARDRCPSLRGVEWKAHRPPASHTG